MQFFNFMLIVSPYCNAYSDNFSHFLMKCKVNEYFRFLRVNFSNEPELSHLLKFPDVHKLGKVYLFILNCLKQRKII